MFLQVPVFQYFLQFYLLFLKGYLLFQQDQFYPKLELLYELYQASSGPIQVIQLLGGKEALVPVEPASRCA